MEIVIRTDGDQVGVQGAAAQAAGQGASQQATQPAAPSPDVAAQAAALGAINAGPARIPAGQMGQPLADIASAADQQTAAGAGDVAAASAGGAPGYSQEPSPTMVEAEGAE